MHKVVILDQGATPGGVSFDIVIAACGYESRCTQVALSLTGRFESIYTFAFPDRHHYSFLANLDVLAGLGTVITADIHEFSARIAEIAAAVKTMSSSGRVPTVAIDISSFDRQRIAILVREFVIHDAGGPLDLTFYYSHGLYESQEGKAPNTIVVNGPLDGFAGWAARPSDPVACLVGLGFEADLALAALETLEPALTVALVPQHEADPRFEETVRRENANLVRTQSDVTVLDYNLDQPSETLRIIESVVHTLKTRHRVAIVPLGPKLFALCALLVATRYPEALAVWRVSLASGAQPIDVLPSGQISHLSIRVSPETISR